MWRDIRVAGGAVSALAPAGYVKSAVAWRRCFGVPSLCVTEDGGEQQRASRYWCVNMKHIHTRQ